jgi:hypothetical protein
VHIKLGLPFELGCNRRGSKGSRAAFCGLCLYKLMCTKYEGRFYYFCSLFVSLTLERTQTAPIVSGDDLCVS